MPIVPGDYQVYLGKWMPDSAPLCAAIGSAQQWSQVLHPAPVMFGKKPFAPPADFWRDHAVLLIGRVVFGAGDTSRIFQLARVSRSTQAITVSVRFAPPQPSSYQMVSFVAARVRKPLPKHVVFVESGTQVCTLDPGSGNWLEPSAP